jgi:hypothetical protein
VTGDDVRLLRECAAGDPVAQQYFLTLYENEIVQTVQLVLVRERSRPVSEKEVDAVITYTVGEVYRRGPELALFGRTLREEVRRLAVIVAERYLRTGSPG